ncbi:hypothetical protein [Actinophytocola sp.]|uniref:hypothetical protein n=1 Tax=Actinophytocola sp. TaxID=1872138 RepID=UPI003D6AA925
MIASGTEAPAPVTLREMVADIARRAAAVPPAAGDELASLLALLVLDPRNTDHVRAVVSVIVLDAMGNSWRETTANRWRPVLPTWIRPAVVGATVQRLRAAGLLVPTGKYVKCTDRAAGNAGKPQPVYRLNLTALTEPTSAGPGS